jgi:PPOX class probable F420-dependent enzyme
VTTTVLPSSPAFLDFWRERRLCTVTTLRPDGTPHVVPMGVVLDPEAGAAWAITSATSWKVRNIRAAGPEGARFAACQVEGRHWSTLEGVVRVLDDEESVREAERRYAERYKVPRPNPERVALRVEITRVLGNLG